MCYTNRNNNIFQLIASSIKLLIRCKVTVKGKKIEEASGLVTSSINPGMFWTHNDSGADAELFLIDQEGNIHLKIFLAGAESFDWEDILTSTTRIVVIIIILVIQMAIGNDLPLIC